MMSAKGEIIEIANPGWGAAGKVDSPSGAADAQLAEHAAQLPGL